MKQKDTYLLVIIPGFIVIVLWVVLSIYHNFVSSTISKPLDMQIQPIAPSFDLKTFNALKTRERVEPLYQLTNTTPVTNSGNASTSAQENTPSQEKTVVSSQSAEINQ